ncbi:MAG: hypothetical protein IT210_25205 [Armatimonadetes bacterium]|nr:hypothetical protein [Armatimonadota bacterium]
MKYKGFWLLGLWLAALWLPCGAQDDGKYKKNWSASGEVTAVNARLKTIDVRPEGGVRYIVEVDFADIFLPGGRKGKINDIPVRARVKVFGRLMPNRIVEGDRIEIEEREVSPDRDTGRPKEQGEEAPQERPDLAGTVSSLDTKKREIRLRTGQSVRTVAVGSRTRIQADGLAVDFKQIPVGSRLEVYGKPDRRNRLMADRIVVDAGKIQTVRTIRGEIARMRSPEWLIQVDDREETVFLTDETTLTLEGKKASPEDAAIGDRVAVKAADIKGKLTAQSIEIIPDPARPRVNIEEKPAPASDADREPPAPEKDKPEPDKKDTAKAETMEGMVVEVFKDDQSFRLRSGNRAIIVDASSTDILSGGKDREFSDIKENARVRATGRMRGDILEATEVEIL